jgi:proteasome accessory factor B
MAAYQERIERLDLLVALIPTTGNGSGFPDAPSLLERLGECYANLATPASRLRAIQRDLKSLTDAERIEVVDITAKPLRYRCRRDAGDEGPGMRGYTRKLMQAVIGESLPSRNLERIWPRLLADDSGMDLNDDKLRILSDTLRLVPADIREGVLAAVLEALSLSSTLRVSYRDAKGKLSQPLLHPQGLLQRGPRVYLYALKEGEPETVRMYALHRMIRAEVGAEPAYQAAGFELQRHIDSGHADFGTGQVVDLKLRARGYVADLLRDCALNETQRIDDEAEDAPFEVVVHATLPATGQLLRWLLGCGDKVEVLGPEDLRRVMAVQAAKMAGLYAMPTGTGTVGMNDSQPATADPGALQPG